ncbi:Actin-related protein [Erysiphe necator]|uniref:Actin-like protein ARP6 n=1 Tax=Uncinula necator TaxID=52586 RepID=A0A0B1PCP3_UNCNE|nr:Actin-related protein [Erysiphe necator]KHJ36028.1 putative actin-related protein [Erysiphe necator]
MSSSSSKTLVLDNGAYTIKAGFSSPLIEELAIPSLIPNCIARDRLKKIYIGSDLATCKDFSEIIFRRPVEKGYLVNWEAEKEIWEHEFFDTDAKLHCDPKETNLILTEAPNSLPALQNNCDQVIFEEFGFQRYLRCLASQLNAYNDVQTTIFNSSTKITCQNYSPPDEILMVIDSGYSHTTITPLLFGRPLQASIRRLDVGGKLLTNYLTRWLSMRNYDMMSETYVVNAIKEATCYITNDFKTDMERAWSDSKRSHYFKKGLESSIVKDYVLPDYHFRSEGLVKVHDPDAATKLKELITGRQLGATEDIITLRNEQFMVPEILFNPIEIGLQQSGIAQQVMDSLSSLPLALWPGLLANIVCVGGNANLEGFIVRLQSEIRALAPTECIVRIARPPNPITSSWLGGASLAKQENILEMLSVTKEEYDENGAGWVARKFAGK